MDRTAERLGLFQEMNQEGHGLEGYAMASTN